MSNPFVVKTKGLVITEVQGKETEERGYLDSREFIYEKIAYDILQLCGVSVPKTCLVEKRTPDGKVRLGLASEFIERYKSLKHYIVKSHKQNNQISKYDVEYHEVLKEGKGVVKEENKSLPIIGLFEALAAMAVIFDHDALGNALNNAGLVPKENELQFYKIDPGNANLGQCVFKEDDLQEALENFEDALDPDLENGLILKCFKTNKTNPAIMRLAEVYRFATKEQKLAGLAKISRIEKKHVEAIIYRKEYRKHLDKVHLDVFVNQVWNRIAAVKKVYGEQIEEYFASHPEEKDQQLNVPIQEKLIRPLEDFLRSPEKINDGWAKPRKFFELTEEQIRLRNKSQTTLLHAAVHNKDTETVEDLVKQGVDVDARDRFGHTPLVYALQQGNKEIAKILLAHGAKKGTKSGYEGGTLLHFAARLGDMTIFNQINEVAKISKDARDIKGRTPRDIAKQYQRKEILEWYRIGDESAELLKLMQRCEKLSALMGKNPIDEENVEGAALKQLIDEIDQELSVRINHNRITQENPYFVEKLNQRFEKNNLLQEVKNFEKLSANFEKTLERYYKKHKSAFGISELRLEAIRNIYKAKKEGNYSHFLAAIITERDIAISLHKKSSRFSFFTSSSLARELDRVLKVHHVTRDKEKALVDDYQAHLSRISVQPNEVAAPAQL